MFLLLIISNIYKYIIMQKAYQVCIEMLQQRNWNITYDTSQTTEQITDQITDQTTEQTTDQTTNQTTDQTEVKDLTTKIDSMSIKEETVEPDIKGLSSSMNKLVINSKIGDSGESKLLKGTTNNGDKYIVFFLYASKLNIASVKSCIEILDKSKTKFGIIIYPDSITASAKKVLQNLHNMKIELFAASELQMNITKHKLASRHIKLNSKEKNEFIKQMGQDIQIILKTDPMSRFYNFEKGDIIRILRNDNTISYRVVR